MISVPEGAELKWGAFKVDTDTISVITAIEIGDVKYLLEKYKDKEDVFLSMVFVPKDESK